MDEATQAALENALEIALEAIYTNSASTPTTPAEPIRALAHQLLGIADGKTGSNEDAVPANSVDPDDTDTWTVAKFVESLALEHHIASAIGVPADADQFEFCKTLTKPELLERLRAAGHGFGARPGGLRSSCAQRRRGASTLCCRARLAALSLVAR